MPTQIQLRRGTTAEHASYTGPEGEVTVNTTDDRLVVHDGTTAGGIPVATKAEKAELAGDSSQDFSAASLDATELDLNGGDGSGWVIYQSGTDLKFKYNGTDRFKLTSAGALVVESNVTAYGSA
jgi:hypothetical protein